MTKDYHSSAYDDGISVGTITFSIARVSVSRRQMENLAKIFKKAKFGGGSVLSMGFSVGLIA